MNVILISPGFPAEMPLFTRGLAQVGASVLGVGDAPQHELPEETRRALAAYLPVQSLLQDEGAVVAAVRERVRGQTIDRVECLWEPGMLLAARLREALGVPGMTVEQTIPFRDKEAMKLALDAAGVRTPKHRRAATAPQVRAAAEEIGFPLIVKPIAGAGSKDTWLLHEPADVEQALELVRHVPEVSVEEYIEGEEYTYDTVCTNGEILFENLSWYRPKPMFMAKHPQISPQSILYRDLDHEDVRAGRELGHAVHRALGFRTGFTHMEWFRTPAGEAVFGEIAARPAGARLVHAMNYCCDIDLFAGWAEAACFGRFSQSRARPWNAGLVFKRARGEGTIRRIEGLEGLLARFGEHIACIDLTPVGQPKRDHRKVLVGDGWIVCRHEDLARTIEIADRIGTDLVLHAG